MPDLRLIQTNFSSGEISPDIRGRVDHEKYKNGADLLCNFITSPTGGITKRGGTHACARIDLDMASSGLYNWEADSSNIRGARLIPFVVDNDNGYALLFLSLASGGCEILVVENYYDVSSAAPFSRPLKRLMLDNSSNLVKVTYDGFSSVVFPYGRDELSQIHFTQIEDTMYLTHPLHKPVKVIRTTSSGTPSGYAFTSQVVSFSDGPYQNLTTNFSGSDIINVSGVPVIDYTYVKFSDPVADGLGSVAVGDWLEYKNGSGDTVIGKILATNNGSTTSNGIPPYSVKVTAQDNVLKGLDSGAVIESSSSSILGLSQTGTAPNGDDSRPSGYLMANASVFSKTHEGYYYKHSQWSPDDWSRVATFSGTAAASTDAITANGHGLSVHQHVRFTAVVGGLSLNTTYYVQSVTTNTFKVSATSGGGLHTITGNGAVTVAIRNSELSSRWVKVKEYLGIRVAKSDSTPPLKTWSGSKSNHETSGQDFHDGRPDAGIEADIVSLTWGTWRPESSSKVFHFENSSPTGQVYEIRRDIFGWVESSEPIFDISRDVGRHFRLDLNGEKVWGILTKHNNGDTDIPSYYSSLSPFNAQFNTTSKFLIKMEVPMPIAKDGSWARLDSLYGNYLNDGRTNLYQFGAWYGGSAPSYPKAVSFYQDRLVFAGSPNDPQSLWLSKPVEYETFSPTDLTGSVLASSGIAYEMVATSNNDILWLNSGDSLLIGTSGGEWKVSPSDPSFGLTPTSIKASRQSSYGSSDIGAIKIGDSVVYIQSQGKTIREMAYNYDSDSFRSLDISIIASHLFGGSRSIAEMAFVKYPHNVLFFRNTLGEVVCMAYDKDQGVFASSRLAMSGVGSAFTTPTQWATSTTYYTGQSASQVYYEGNGYVCKRSHTSSSFLEDLHSGKWEPSGGNVVSICGMPASNERETDSLLMLVKRDPVYYNSSHNRLVYSESDVTPYLSLEYMYPYGLSGSDHGASTFRDMTPDGTGDHHMDLSIGTGYPQEGGSYAFPSFGSISEYLIEEDLCAKLPYPTKDGGVAKLPNGAYIKCSAVVYSSLVNAIETYPNETHYAALVNESGTLKLRVRLKSDHSNQALISNVPSGKRIFCVIGFGFPSILQTLPVESSGEGGTTSGRVKRVNEYSLKFLSSGPFRSGVSSIDTMDNGHFFSGDVQVTADNEYGELQTVTVSSDSPGPMNILSISTELTINR